MRKLRAIRLLLVSCILLSAGATVGGFLAIQWLDQNLVQKTRAEVEEAELVSDLEAMKEVARSASLAVVAAFKAVKHTVLIATGVLVVLTVLMLLTLAIALRIRP